MNLDELKALPLETPGEQFYVIQFAHAVKIGRSICAPKRAINQIVSSRLDPVAVYIYDIPDPRGFELAIRRAGDPARFQKSREAFPSSLAPCIIAAAAAAARGDSTTAIAAIAVIADEASRLGRPNLPHPCPCYNGDRVACYLSPHEMKALQKLAAASKRSLGREAAFILAKTLTPGKAFK